MPTIWIPPRVVTVTFARLAGIKRLLQAIDTGVPEAEWASRESLQRTAAAADWPAEEYFLEDKILDEELGYWMRRLAWYSVVALCHSLVESQLFACGDSVRVARGEKVNVAIKRRALDRARQHLRSESGFDVRSDPAWPDLLRLEDIRGIVLHRGGSDGESDAERTKVQQLAEIYPGKLQVNDQRDAYHHHIFITKSLCDQFVEVIEGFFTRVFAALGFTQMDASPPTSSP
jgi:hypothetical protein